jgi:tetratricopeptide (TPR) repeat protein
MVRELAQRNLRSLSFLDAALIASGAPQERMAAYRQRYQNLLDRIRRDIPLLGLDDMGRAAKIFELMHRHGMTTYKSEETTLLEILDAGNFNCVSGTLLYNLLAAEFGFETRIVVVPEHVYSQVRVGRNWIDVETTSPAGFHPLRVPGATAPNRAFIEDRSGRKTFMPTERLIALLYYNRGTLAHNQKNYPAAAALLIRALHVFPEHFEAQENLLATMIEWAKVEGEAGRVAAALSICDEAERALGQHRDIAQMRALLTLLGAENSAKRGDFAGAVSTMEQYIRSQRARNPEHEMVLRGYLLKWAQQSLQQGQYDTMLDLIRRASASGRDAQAESMSLHLITEAAKQIAQSEGFENGYAFFERQYPLRNESAAVRQNRLHIYGLWLTSEVDARRFEEAYALNRTLIQAYPQNQDIRRNAAWIVQRWSNDIAANSAEGEYLPRMIALHRKYREPSITEEMVNRSLREINQLQQNRHYARAEEKLKQLRDLRLGEPHARSISDMSRVVMINWGVHHANRGEFLEAIEAGKHARALFPNDDGINTNLARFYVSAGQHLLNRQEFESAARVIDEGIRTFPRNAELRELRRHIP